MRRDDPKHATVVVTGLFMVGLLCGALAGRAAVARVQDPYAHLELFARVLATIQEDYVEELPPERLIDAAITGMIDELDSQSRWLDAEQLRTLRDEADGTTTGIGIEVRPVDHGVEVTRVVPGSPALREGLAEGDTIVAIDGRDLAGLGLDEVREWFDGDRGDTTALTVMRDGWTVPRVVEATHDTMRRQAVESALLDGSVAYVRLDQFQEGAAEDIEAHIHVAAESLGGTDALSGVVLDLRDNPGGLLSEAVAVADLFLDEGVIVRTLGRSEAALSDHADVHRASSGGLPADLRTVVLINGMSASASEIVTGALQDTGRAVIVGERSYGKGTVQQVYMHLAPDSAALKLTVGTYTTPSGKPVAPREGRVPDVVVPWATTPRRSEQLQTRLAALDIDDTEREELLALVAGLRDTERPRAVIPWETPVLERAPDDPQLQAALRIASGSEEP